MTDYYKYPKTLHTPWSPGTTSDDRLWREDAFKNAFEGKMVTVSEKLDGENSSLYCDKMHARSIDSRHHVSRNWLKKLHGEMKHLIPEGWRVCGENMFAKHSIHYQNLDDYFYVFAVYDENNVCLSVQDTEAWTLEVGFSATPWLYRGVYDEEAIRALFTGKSVFKGSEQEGYVIRLDEAFAWEDHMACTAKYVRKNHVQTDKLWMNQPMVPNLLANLDKT